MVTEGFRRDGKYLTTFTEYTHIKYEMLHYQIDHMNA